MFYHSKKTLLSNAQQWLLNKLVQQTNCTHSSSASATNFSSLINCSEIYPSETIHLPEASSTYHFPRYPMLKHHKPKHQEIAASAVASSTTALPSHIFQNHSAANANTTLQTSLSSQWIFDTGATAHMCSDSNQFTSLHPHTGSICLADQSTISVTGIGTVILYCDVNNVVTTITLNDVLLVPGLGRSLFSWRSAKRKNSCVLVDNGILELKDKSDNRTFLQTRDIDNNFIVNTCQNSAGAATYEFWHSALGHPAVSSLKPALYSDGNQIPAAPHDFECHTCRISKSKHSVPRPIGTRSTERFDLIHSDICGPFPHADLDGNRYFLTVIDDYTRFSKVYFLKEKSQAASTIMGFIKYVETQFGKTIKGIKTDQGGEYISNELTDFLTSKGIEHYFSPAYLHESNGTAERYNQTLCTIARTGMTIFPNHPQLWSEAIYYACFTKNRLPHAALQGETPYFVYFGEKPELKNLRPFGSECYTHIPVESRSPGKLLPRALEGRFVGYSRSEVIHRIYVPENDNVYESRDVIFPGQNLPSIFTDQRSHSLSPTPSHIQDPLFPPSSSTSSGPSSDYYEPGIVEQPRSRSISVPLTIPPMPDASTTPQYMPSETTQTPSRTPAPSYQRPPADSSSDPETDSELDPNATLPAIPDDIHHGFSDDSSVDEYDSASIIRPQYRIHPVQPAERRLRPATRPGPSSTQVQIHQTQPAILPAPSRSAPSTPARSRLQIEQAPSPIPTSPPRQITPAPPASETLISYSEHISPNAPRVSFNDTIQYREPSSIVSSSDSDSTEAPLPVRQTSRFGRISQPPRNWWEVNHPAPIETDDDRSMTDASEPDARSDLTMANALLAEDSEPKFYKHATMGPDSDHWTNAINAEMSALERNRTWEVVNKPADRKVIGSKWVFKIKYDASGNVEKYKARLVAKGFSQIEGLDYDELFAPVVRFDSLRLLLAVAAKNRWIPAQMDVTAAFLYPELQDDLYMQLPEGYRQEGKVAKLKKCIYGLKQSPREWYARLATTLNKLGFNTSKFDPCVFIHATQEFFIAVYVDDISLFGPPGNLMNSVKGTLSSEFEMKDLGSLHWLLGLEIIFTDSGINITQTAYFEKILKRFQMLDCNPCALPIDPHIKFEDKPVVSTEEIRDYQSVIGSLMYAVSATRPDLCFAVSFLSQFNHSPTIQHMQAAKRVLRYLNGTKTLGLYYPYGQSLDLVTFSDADYANCPTTRKSISGNIVQLSTATISWRSKKQKSVSTSTAEAEYQALSLAVKQTIWTKNALLELAREKTPTPIVYCDNKAAIDIAQNPKISDRSKHIDVHFHFVRENVEKGTFFIMPVATADNLADTCTKGLPGLPFKNFREKILGLN
jgi:transposase InsO family protein